MKISGANILVTGGAGFIGSHLVDALMRENCHVRVFDNLANGKQENLEQHRTNNNFEFIFGSVIDSSAVVKAMRHIDIVYHLACLGVRHSIKHPLENHFVNAEGALLVLKEAQRAGIKRFIHCSSSEVYGTADYVPMPETHPTHPSTVYGASKLAGEAYARAFHKIYGFSTIIIRPFNTYGPRSHHEEEAGEFIPKSIIRILNKEPILIFGDGSQTRDFTYVEDVAAAFVDAARKDNIIGQTFNVGSNSEICIKDIAKKILEMTGSSPSKIEYLDNRPGDVSRLCSDSTRFRKITNWKPKVQFEEGLLKTIEWFKTRPEGIVALLDQEKGVNWQ